MTLVDEIRKNVTESTPLMAAVGVTDLAVERVRAAAVNAAHLQHEFEKIVAQFEVKPREWQARVRTVDVHSMQQMPVVAVHRVLVAAGRVEDSYGRLAERGKDLVDRARATAPAQDFLRQGRVTVSRARAVVTSARRTVDESAAAARGIFTTGRREAVETASAVEAEVVDGVTATEKLVEERTRGTRAAVQGAAATVRQRAAATRMAARSATTSARKTVRKAVDAVEAVAAEIGESPAARAAEAPAGEASVVKAPGPRSGARAATRPPARPATRPATRAGAKSAPKPAAGGATPEAPAAPDAPVE